MAIVSIEGQRQRHSPSIGIRVTGIEELELDEVRVAELAFFPDLEQPCGKSRGVTSKAISG